MNTFFVPTQEDEDPAKPKTGGCAFPTPFVNDNGSPAVFLGMTLRDYFAAQALPGVLDRMRVGAFVSSAAAGMAYEMADAMLARK